MPFYRCTLDALARTLLAWNASDVLVKPGRRPALTIDGFVASGVPEHPVPLTADCVAALLAEAGVSPGRARLLSLAGASFEVQALPSGDGLRLVLGSVLDGTQERLAS